MKVDVKMARSFNKAGNPETFVNGHVVTGTMLMQMFTWMLVRGEDGNPQTIKNIMRCLITQQMLMKKQMENKFNLIDP